MSWIDFFINDDATEGNPDTSGDGLGELSSQLEEAGGPTRWAFTKITEFMIGMAIGTATGIADVIADTIGAVEESFTFASEQATAAFDALGSGAIGGVSAGFDALARAADIAGPLGPLVYIVVAAVLVALAWRIINALADSVPIASGIQTLLESN